MGGNQSTHDPPSNSHADAPSAASAASPLPVHESSSGISSSPGDPGITVVNAGRPSSKPTLCGDGNVEASRCVPASQRPPLFCFVVLLSLHSLALRPVGSYSQQSHLCVCTLKKRCTVFCDPVHDILQGTARYDAHNITDAATSSG
jgi:hypothetical protein